MKLGFRAYQCLDHPTPVDQTCSFCGILAIHSIKLMLRHIDLAQSAADQCLMLDVVAHVDLGEMFNRTGMLILSACTSHADILSAIETEVITNENVHLSAILEREQGTCWECGFSVMPENAHIRRTQVISHYFDHSLTTTHTALLCGTCGEMTRITPHPRKPEKITID